MTEQDKGFGFAALKRIKPDADEVDPAVTARREPSDEEIDRVAESHGFVSREPIQKLVKRKATKEPAVALNMRVAVSTYNAFVAFSQRERLSYPEALEEILRREKLL